MLVLKAQAGHVPFPTEVTNKESYFICSLHHRYPGQRIQE